MCVWRTEEAGALAKRIPAAVTHKSSSWLYAKLTPESVLKKYGLKCVIIRGRTTNNDNRVDGLTGQTFNDYYAAI